MTTVVPLAARLRSARWDTFESAVREAVTAGAPGDAALAAACGGIAKSRVVSVVAALGDTEGAAGTALLRTVLRTERTPDLLCAALLALAKRCGADASADLLGALPSHSGEVKDHAVLGLAGAGDDRAWEQVYARLRQLLIREPKRRAGDVGSSPVAAAVCYLGRHLDGERTTRLVGHLRERWTRLTADERVWLTEFWPGVRPDGPAEGRVPAPDPDALRDWVRHRHFGPVT